MLMGNADGRGELSRVAVAKAAQSRHLRTASSFQHLLSPVLSSSPLQMWEVWSRLRETQGAWYPSGSGEAEGRGCRGGGTAVSPHAHPLGICRQGVGGGLDFRCSFRCYFLGA